MLIYSFITDYQAFNLRYKDNTTRDKNETKVDKQSANLGKNNEPIQNRLSFLIDCKSVILHHLAILSFPMVRPAWDNWWLLVDDPDFGLIGYGANVRTDKNGTVSITPLDGVRRQIRIMTPVRFSIELMQDGFRKDHPVTLKGAAEELSFFIENRSGKRHNTTIRTEGMPEGKYTVMTDHKMITTFHIEAGNTHHPYYIEVPVTDKHTQVKLLKTN